MINKIFSLNLSAKSILLLLAATKVLVLALQFVQNYVKEWVEKSGSTAPMAMEVPSLSLSKFNELHKDINTMQKQSIQI